MTFVLPLTCSSVFVKFYSFVFKKINAEDAARHLSPKQTGCCLHAQGSI